MQALPQGPCKICGRQSGRVPDNFFPEWHCPHCGSFDYDTTLGWLDLNTPDAKLRIAGWIREQNAGGISPVRITQAMARSIIRRPPPRLRERADKVLSVIARKYPDFQTQTNFATFFEDLEIQGQSYSKDAEEVRPLVHILIEDGYLFAPINNMSNRATSAALTVKGMIAAEELGITASSSALGFVAMSFEPSLRTAWTNGFDPAIRTAGYLPLRIDEKEFLGGITDQIMAEIRRSRFVVADYTGQKNGVYFEAGFALGLPLPVIPTCRADQIDGLHFDIKHLNTLVWKNEDELADLLAKRIRAIIGLGPNAIDNFP
jgi:hypothetical protein